MISGSLNGKNRNRDLSLSRSLYLAVFSERSKKGENAIELEDVER